MSKMSRILIISPDIEGPVINGGIGTAFTALADMLVQNNEDVDILYTSGRYSESTHGFEHWNTIYKEYRINLIQLAVDESLIIDAPHFRKQSYQTYLWLKDNDKYDKIIGCEWQGALYYTLLAKKQGLNFNNTEIIINTHGSSMWADEGNYSLPRDQNHLELYYLEQKCVELADSVVSPSAYLIQWMRNKKWKLPFNTKVIFNCEPSLIFRTGKHPIVNEDENTEMEDTCYDGIELVFFGRLEIRKGLDLFIKSLKNFNLNNKNKISKITFMGKNIAIDGFDAMDFIDINGFVE
ncbi:glycosyltransferase family 4 protein [Shimwellia pseudoproteus]|uniref:hypothetical protein n=1 Tax=Shimwellia pseudoproteus TaxID=570012 RepID=UPI0018EA6062|nr:hypothetical protein [Shimwellia pseudoproteus]MBJ3817053.1 glycosyltransferase family 4 protein [Shimwellia pseudoproteus]